METVFKLSRAEVELACTQFLASRGVRFTDTAKLVDLPSKPPQDFEELSFHGTIDLSPPAAPPEPNTGALDRAGYRAEVERTPAHVPDEAPHHVSAKPARVAPAPVEKSTLASSLEKPVPARPHGSAPKFREGNVGGGAPVGGSQQGMGAQLGKLMSSEPPSTVKLPPSVVDFRNKTP